MNTQFDFSNLPIEVRRDILSIVFVVDKISEEEREEMLTDHEGLLSRLTYLAWLKANDLIGEFLPYGFPEWVADHCEFDLEWYDGLNSEGHGINVEATWEYYDLDRILHLVKN